jgi:RNA-binding protein
MLTSKQRAYLRSLAHPLKPVHQIGKEGVTEASATAVLEAFNRKELIKVKVQEAAPIDVREAADTLTARYPEIECVQTIGRSMVLYRRHPDEPEIELPRR